ncbi:hypothetical protein NA57DRAFT_67349 [Rhizodiscina lignyota]|uniref:Protein SDS23 n=1 Tax=Rhizodiscina lignyota TaxID=1504668 RepID=A0A9P4M3G7_9PEZI|nr:hypothetical protein NA57DRAFT_67349 [Rhizodiscina lignyota]
MTEALRGPPGSPRAHRQPSLSQQAFQDLLNNPPVGQREDSRFVGRDWRTIQAHELIALEEVRFVEMDTSVEDATNLLIEKGAPNVVLIRENTDSTVAISTFDYNDLNAYLLLVVGLARPEPWQLSHFNEITRMARASEPIPLRMVKDLGRKEPLVKLPSSSSLTKAVEIFGSGIHRIIITKDGSDDVLGIITQLRLVRFFWEHGRNFPAIDQLYHQRLRDLSLGSQSVFAINGDKPLTEALELMHNESITSLPVLDNQSNVIGNISHVDVRLLTKSTSLPLLRSSCIHFISVILTERGVNDGADPYPVFHVNPFSTLAHTVAKLVATRSHRMWIVDEPSPSSSGPPTPALTPAALVPPPNPLSGNTPVTGNPSAGMPHTPQNPGNSTLTAAAVPGSSMSGRLTGVVSLTDILNLFAKASGLSPHDPNETRRQRRRSSSASFRRSMDSDVSAGRSVRSESESLKGGPVSRTASISGRPR